jgi:LysR family glycine cleavage system transcriptional activator
MRRQSQAAPGERRLPLPSLNALFVFEAAARHGSFTRAAVELRVTQTAVSHQVKALEAELGVALFRRSPRRLALTAEGQAWAAELRLIFQRLRETNQKLRASARGERPVVAISVIPSLGARWLVPRLGKFLAQHSNIDVHISASEHLVDFGLEPFDVGIRYGSGHYPGLTCEKLADDAWVVVSSPELLARNKLRTAADLVRETLLYDDHPRAWSKWFEACGVRDFASAGRNQITDSSMVIEAAIRGQGIALARWSLACDELHGGRLALVFPKLPLLPTGTSYYLVGPRESFRRAPVAAFRDWVRLEAQSLTAQI